MVAGAEKYRRRKVVAKPRRLLRVVSLCVRTDLNSSLTKFARCIMIYICRSVGSHCRRVSCAITFVVGARFVHLAFVLAHQAANKIYLNLKIVLCLILVQSQGGRQFTFASLKEALCLQPLALLSAEGGIESWRR